MGTDFLKRCYKCNKEKALDEFAKDNSRRDRLQPMCRLCKKEYSINNQDRLLELSNTWKKNNPDHFKIWAAANPDKRRNNYQKWKLNNRERAREYDSVKQHKRRALLAGCLEPSATANEMAELKRNSVNCAMCEIYLEFKNRTFEHIIPIAMGGSNALTNLSITCLKCNLSRPKKSLDWFAHNHKEE